MSAMHQFLSIAGQVLLLSVLITIVTGRFVTNISKHKFVVAILLALCLFIPVYGLSIAQWLRSVLGDLSVLLLVILSNILAQRLFNFNLLQDLSGKILLLGVMLVGVVFYPLALGLSSVDPYYFGYMPTVMVALLLLASVVAWLGGLRDLAVVMLLPLLAFNLQLLESTNLWDYLLDPVLFVYVVVQSLARINLPHFKKNRSTG